MRVEEEFHLLLALENAERTLFVIDESQPKEIFPRGRWLRQQVIVRSNFISKVVLFPCVAQELALLSQALTAKVVALVK